MFARVGGGGVVGGFFDLRDEEGVGAYGGELLADVCGGGAAAYKEDTLETGFFNKR